MDLLEMVKSKYPEDVKDFLNETFPQWIPFFIHILDAPFPPPEDPNYKGVITIKTQVVKTAVKMKHAFSSHFATYLPGLFASTWNSLNSIKDRYSREFVANSQEGRLVDSDGLSFSLDLFVLEEIEFVKLCIKSKDVKAEVEVGEGDSSPLSQLVYTAIILSQIAMEDVWALEQQLGGRGLIFNRRNYGKLTLTSSSLRKHPSRRIIRLGTPLAI